MKVVPPIANVISSPDRFFDDLAARLLRVRRVDTLVALEHELGRTEHAESIDIISHSNGHDKLLAIGNEVLDSRRPAVMSMFARLARRLRDNGVQRLRLLGCGTATREAGRRTIRDLARTLQPITVFGTTDMIGPRSFDRAGLRAQFSSVLIHAGDTRPQ